MARFNPVCSSEPCVTSWGILTVKFLIDIMKALGKLRLDHGNVRIHFSHDLARYWNHLLVQKTGMIFQLPMRPSKVGIYRPNSYHDKAIPCQKELRKIVRGERSIEVCFDPCKINYVFSRKKGYWVSWVNVGDDKNIQKLIDRLGLSANFDSYNQPHLSISNSKYCKGLKGKSKKWLWDNQFTTKTK
jgi:hypothetical protein